MKKYLKKLCLIGITFAMILNNFSPLIVFANSGGQSISVTFVGGNINGNIINYSIDTDDVTVTVDSTYTLNNSTLNIDSTNFLGALSIENFKSDIMNIKIYSGDGFQDNIIYNNGTLSRENTEGGYPNTFNFVIEKKNSGHAGGESQEQPFDGTAWFMWKGPNGEFCKYHIDNINSATDNIDETGRMARVYPTKYIKQSDVVSNGVSLDISALTDDSYYWVNNSWYESAGHNTAIESITTWNEFDSYIKSIIPEDDYDSFKAFAYDPCGAKNGNNSISTNGDRAFRATIYNDTAYYGISNASNANDLTYFPNFWDSTFFNPAIDISGTSLSKPAVIETYLLEPKIILSKDIVSYDIDNIEIASDIPSGVADITNNNGKWEIKFNSNYYDKVVFKITSDSKNYYVMLSRITIMSDGQNVGVLVPTADIEDYDVIATYYFADGTKENCILKYSNQSDGGMNITAKNYKLSDNNARKINLSPTSTNGPIGVSYTVMKSGSTSTSYSGTLSGSGQGTYFKIIYGHAVVDYTK